MKLTTKGKFAVTAMLDIAMYSENNIKPVNLFHISERQSISLSYLEQLFVKLRKNGLVKSYKGPGGGYVLGNSLEKLSVSEIIRAVDDDMDARTCRGNKNCRDNKKCITHDLWNGLTKEIYQYLDNISLGDLVTNSQQDKANKIVFCKN